jgi:hypothetical protein
MTWRLYALTSGGAVLVTALAAFVAPLERTRVEPPAAVPQAVDRSGVVVDLGAQADRLKTKLAEVNAYRHPARNAFRFGMPPARVVEPSAPPVNNIPVLDVAPVRRPPYGLAGMATSVVNGVTQRTAILSSLQGVSLVKEGDVLETGYRVMSIGDDAVILESTSDGAQTTLRLSSSDLPPGARP